MEDRAREAPSELRGSKGAIPEPRMIDYAPNAPNKAYNWSLLCKDYVAVFTDRYDFFQDIITTGEHHVFGPNPEMTFEQDQRIVDIIPLAAAAERVWQAANPQLGDDFVRHGARSEQFARNKTASERELLSDAIKQKRNQIEKERTKYVDKYPKVFEYIKSKCTTSMIAKLSQDDQWEVQTTITKDPRYLWNAIHNAMVGIDADIDLVNDPVNNQKIILETTGLKAEFDRRKQGDHEPTHLYHDWFVESRNGLLQSGIIIDEPVAAAQFVLGLDNNRYNKMKDDLRNTLETTHQNIYPQNVPDAFKLAMTYSRTLPNQNKPYQPVSSIMYAKDGGPNDKNLDDDEKQILYEKVHSNNKYDNSRKSDPDGRSAHSFHKISPTCTWCGLFGHSIDSCFGKDLPKDQAMANGIKFVELLKNSQHRKLGYPDYKLMADENKKLSGDDIKESSNASPKYKNKKHANDKRGSEVKQTFIIKNVVASITNNEDFKSPVIICDTGADVGIYKDRNLLYNLRDAETPLQVEGIINSKLLDISKVGTSKLTHTTVYYHPDAVANIECFFDVKEIAVYFEISDDASTFTFDLIDGSRIVFQADKNNKIFKLENLFDIDDIKINDHIYVTTVKDNEKLFDKRQVAKAKQARVFQNNLGCSTSALKLMLRNGTISDVPFTTHDVDIAEDIYGPSISSLKGRTVDTIVKEKIVHSTDKYINTVTKLFVDILFIAGLPFLMAVNSFGYMMVRKLKNRSAEQCKFGLDNFIAAHKAQGFKISDIETDEEKGVLANLDYYATQEIKINVAGKGSHVAVAENKIKQLKSQCRTTASLLPYSLTLVLLASLVIASVFTINCIPQFSKDMYQSPRELFTGQRLHYGMINGGFGDYALVNAHNDIKNNLQPRMLDCISLYPIGDARGSRKFLDLNTGNIITRSKFVIMPVPEPIIERMNALSIKEGLTINKKLKDWKMSKDVEIYNEDFDSQTYPMSEIERENFKRISNDLNFDIDMYTNQDALSTQSINSNVEFSSEQSLSLEQQSEAIVNEFNPTIHDAEFSNSDQQYISTNYWPVQEQPTSTQLIPTHPYNLRSSNSQILLAKSKVKKGNITPEQGMLMGKIGEDSMLKELKQMLDLKVWSPILKSDIPTSQFKNIIRSRMFLKEKRNGTIKSRLVAGGHMQDRNLYSIINTSSPTVSTDSLLILLAIYAYKRCKIITIDIVSAYLNCKLEKIVYMSLDKIMAKLLVKLDSTYSTYVNEENGNIYVMLQKALYGLIESAKLFYNHLSGSLLSLGFIQNDYDQCVFNRTCKSNKQLTVCFHVDDLLCASECESDLYEFAKELKNLYIDVTVSTGVIHDYLGIDVDFSEDGYCKLDMTKYVKKILEDNNVMKIKNSPATDELFMVNDDSELLSKEDNESFHSVVAQLLYLSKRARPDILPTVAFLTTRVLEPTIDDWNKLARLLNYLNGSKNIIMKLSCDASMQIECYVDASFSNHLDCKSHSGCVITLGSGAVHCKSSKQSLNTKSSTEAELVAISDCVSIGLWARNFMDVQQGGEKCFLNLNGIPPAKLYQDNLSTIQLITKGRSTSMRTRHINIRYFFIHDRIIKKEIIVLYKPTTLMVADFMTKPLHGKNFIMMRKMLLNHDEIVCDHDAIEELLDEDKELLDEKEDAVEEN